MIEAQREADRRRRANMTEAQREAKRAAKRRAAALKAAATRRKGLTQARASR